MDDAISTFTAMRPQLERIAYRILRSHAQARAVVDSVSLSFRCQACVLEATADPKAWLVTATSRLALERLISGGARSDDSGRPPALASDPVMSLTDDILTATLVALEQLEPDARLAFLLHDIFDADLAEVATTLGRNEAECRDLMDRARQELHRHHHRDVP
jgi:RNA polymerase sigma-70 factor (ECF subfamily)